MNSIMNVRENAPANTFIGPGSSCMAGLLCEQMGLKKAFIICDAGVKQAGLVDGILKSLEEKGVSTYLFDRVTADAPDTAIDAAAEICREQTCQVVIGVGGGSSLDTAKCVAMLQNNPGKIAEYVTDPNKPRAKGAPLFLIPTTAGTGSEVTYALVVAVESMGAKLCIGGKDLYADVALIDPMMTLSLPRKQTASTGMDAFAHCVEAMLSGIANPICDLFSLEGIRLITNNLEKVMENGKNVEARQNVMLAAYLAGMSVNDGGCNFGHALAHVIGAEYHIPHGELCAVALPMVIEYFAEIFPEKIRKIAEAMGIQMPFAANNAETAAIVADAVRALRTRLGLPKFSDFAFGYEDLPRLSEMIMTDNCVNALRLSVPNHQVTPEDFLIPMQKEYNRN